MIVCREDTKPDGSPGDFVLATRQVFTDMFKALKYGQSISPSREPHLLKILDSVQALADDYQESLDRMEDPEPADMDPLFGKESK
jgi:hypothetical protein